MCILWQKSLTLSRTETANLIWKLQHLRCEAAEAKTPLRSMHDRSDLEQVPVHYVLATEGAHRHCRRDGGGGGGEGGRRVFVLFKNIIRTGWTLTKRQKNPTCEISYPHIFSFWNCIPLRTRVLRFVLSTFCSYTYKLFSLYHATVREWPLKHLLCRRKSLHAVAAEWKQPRPAPRLPPTWQQENLQTHRRWLMSSHIAATLDPNKTRINRPTSAQIIDIFHDWRKDNFIITFAVNSDNNLCVWTRQTESFAEPFRAHL